jgi:hypothetical protein
VRREGGRLFLDGVKVRAGGTSLAVTGVLGAPPRLVGTDLTVRAAGKDLSKLSRLAGLRLPAGPFDVAGRLLRRKDGLAIDAAELRSRVGVFHAKGTLGEPPQLSGMDLTVDAAGPDLAELSEVATVGLPRAPFSLRGRVARDGDALRLDAVEGRLGDGTVSGGGRLALANGLEGTGLELRVAGRDLAALAALAGVRGAPAEPFDVKGRVRVVRGGYELEGVEGSVGRVSAAVEGRVGAAAGLDGTSLSCRARGPVLSALAAWGLPGHLPPDPFSIEGRLRIESGVWRVDGVVAEVGADRAHLEGTLGALPDLSLLATAVSAAGPSLAGLGRFLGRPQVAPPDGSRVTAYEASGRVRRVPSGWELRDALAKAGGAVIRVEGTVGTGEGLAGTDLRLDASGPDLATTLGPIRAARGAPPLPFEVSAEVAGGVERLAARRFTARLGASDLEGSFSARLREKPPALEAELRSRRLDVAELMSALDTGPAGGAGQQPPGGARVVPGDPLKLDALRAVDATLRIEVAELQGLALSLRGVRVAGALRGGALRIDSAEATGLDGGRASAQLALEPTGGGYRLSARGRVEGVRLVDASTATSREKAPSLDADFDLTGEGRSLRDVAASLDGDVAVAVGSGRISNAHQRMTSAVVRSLLDALNPFRASSDYTDLECGIASATMKNGRASVEPIAVQTDKMTVVGHGKVDFRTEEIELEWTLKPKTGVGLAPGAIANPYVKLGGTLSAPKLEVKRLEAAANAGAAVATMGLTVLAQGFYGRITAEKKVCVDSVVKRPVPAPAEQPP